MKLTLREAAVLEAYLPSIFEVGRDDGVDLRSVDRDRFVSLVAEMDFDGQIAAADRRMMCALHKKGAFSAFELHYDIAQQPCAYVEISREGAEKLFELREQGRLAEKEPGVTV